MKKHATSLTQQASFRGVNMQTTSDTQQPWTDNSFKQKVLSKNGFVEG
jgi:hypothetical protein